MRPAPNVVRVALGGEIDLSDVRLLETSLREVEDDLLDDRLDGSLDGGSGEFKLIALDLGKVEFIDSAGLAALVQAQWRIESRGGRLALVSAPEHVKRLFALTGLDSRFDFLDSASLEREVR